MGIKTLEEFTEIVLSARPNSAASSIKIYHGIYKKLDCETEIEGIREYKKLNEWIQENIKNNSTKRNYFVVCMIITEAINGGKYTDKWAGLPEWQFYKSKVDELLNPDK